MKLLTSLIEWWTRIWAPAPPQAPVPSTRQFRLPARFPDVIVTEMTPPNEQIGARDFYLVVHKRSAYWALFRCPCDCGDVISLPLRASHRPRWTALVNAAGEPTLSPSIWRNRGCMSHFWVDAGRIKWCRDTGFAPSDARPDLYARPNR